MRSQVMKIVSGTSAEWFARDVYYKIIGSAPGILLPPEVLRGRDYDRLTISIAAHALVGGGNAIDIGANVGQILRTLVRLSPAGSHWAFEPIPRFAARLRAKFPGVKVEEVALSDHTGTEAFRFIPRDPAYSSLLIRPDIEAGHEVCVLRACVRCLDNCLPVEFPVTFVKIDVEGAEAAVLRGMSRTLQVWRPVVVFECSPVNLRNCLPPLEAAGLRVSFLTDYCNTAAMSHEEVAQAAMERGEFYFVAAPPVDRRGPPRRNGRACRYRADPGEPHPSASPRYS